MFKSFFPRPRVFFASAVLWCIFAVVLWYTWGVDAGRLIGLAPPPPGTRPVLGLRYFVTPEFIWFYIYCGSFLALFTAAWMILAPHRWHWWSITGSALILFSDYFSVQASVAINNWQRPFFDAIQKALSGKSNLTTGEFYHLLGIFAEIAFVWMIVYVATRFFTSHYVFRWRTAMNDYYMGRWPDVRLIEGAAQRVQEDTMRFASIVEDLGVSMIDSIMTLFAFLPVLARLSRNITDLPIVGHIPEPLLVAAIFWSAFGTILLAVAGIRLPGLAFLNQRTEAAYRKELVYGEDDGLRADPITVNELFMNVRKAYFRYYFHFAYFNIFRGMYIQADNVFGSWILIPTIVAGKITFGIMNQILTAFGQVSGSFQYLVSSWTTIIELLSIQKRLKAFERAFEGQELSPIDRDYTPPGA